MSDWRQIEDQIRGMRGRVSGPDREQFMTCAEHRSAVLEEVRLIVVEALRDHEPVRADGIAKIVAWTYPQSGLTREQIAERIKAAATAAGVPVESGNASWGTPSAQANPASPTAQGH